MKQILISLSALLVFQLSATAQEVGEESHPMVAGSQNAFYIDLPDATSSFVEKEWKDYIDKYGKAKKVKKSSEWLVADTQILNIGGTNTINLYSRSEETGTTARQYLWVESGGEYISSANNADAAKAAGDILRDFAHRVKVDQIAIELDNQQKALDNLEKDLSKLKKDNDNYHKTIEDAKDRIAKAESDLAKNVQDQQLRMQEIDQQRKVVGDVQAKLDKARSERN